MSNAASFAHAIRELKAGNYVTIKPTGNSMTPRIKSGQEVELRPVIPNVRYGCVCVDALRVGDAVLVKCRGRVMLHLIKAINGDRLLIGNNHGRINGWTHKTNVYGIAYT
jgi:hypothetical protein